MRLLVIKIIVSYGYLLVFDCLISESSSYIWKSSYLWDSRWQNSPPIIDIANALHSLLGSCTRTWLWLRLGQVHTPYFLSPPRFLVLKLMTQSCLCQLLDRFSSIKLGLVCQHLSFVLGLSHTQPFCLHF
jgi:hypothetical protein